MKNKLSFFLAVIGLLVVSILPAAQNVKTVGGVAIASVKTAGGLAIASVKTIGGVDNTAGGGGSTVIELDGVDDIITTGAIDLSADNTYTFSCWVRTNANALTESWQPILIEPADSTGLYLRSSGLFQFYPAATPYTTVTSVAINTWYHYAFVNNSGTWNAYINGVSNANGTGAGNGPNAMTRIGADGGDQFGGRISELACFSIALNGTQVGNLASKSTTPDVIGSLVAYIKFNDVANGASGDGVTFAASGGTSITASGNDGATNGTLLGVTLDY